MKAPVPPAQEPFIRTSRPLVRKRILASSPPSSMMTSVPGASRLAATRVANTSCTKGAFTLSAMPMPAEPEMANTAFPAILCRYPPQQFRRLFYDMAVMPLICTVYQFVPVIQYHAFDGSGANIQSDAQNGVPPLRAFRPYFKLIILCYGFWQILQCKKYGIFVNFPLRNRLHAKTFPFFDSLCYTIENIRPERKFLPCPLFPDAHLLRPLLPQLYRSPPVRRDRAGGFLV